jgi:RNA methyltransferase, TrmH family
MPAKPPRDRPPTAPNPWALRERGPAPRAPAGEPSRPPRAHPKVADEEMRLYGLNACLAAFAARPADVRKLWLREDRVPALKAVLAWCAKHRIGYRVVEDEDLRKLAASEHHEGVVFAVKRRAELDLASWLAGLPAGPALALWLGGVGNPHNLGAILRSAAHFGVAGVLLEAGDPLALSGAACRVAEGGAEALPLVRLPARQTALGQLRKVGFATAATVVRGGEDVFAARLPPRLVLAMGAESEGLAVDQAAAFGQRLEIPGSGAVESLNVSAATAVFLAEWARQRR